MRQRRELCALWVLGAHNGKALSAFVAGQVVFVKGDNPPGSVILGRVVNERVSPGGEGRMSINPSVD